MFLLFVSTQNKNTVNVALDLFKVHNKDTWITSHIKNKCKIYFCPIKVVWIVTCCKIFCNKLNWCLINVLLNWHISQLTFTCSKSTTETLEKTVKWCRSGAFIVNFENIWHHFLFILLFEQVDVSWVIIYTIIIII